MPNIMIHERVGEYISKKIAIDSYDFYLGLLAPDAPNIEGFAPKEERWMAHQRKKDYQEWRKSILEFYNREKGKYPKDFLLGYYIHVLTDIVYDDFLYLKVRSVIEEKATREESHTIMREDMDKYYFEGIERIKELLESKEESYEILNITKDTLLKWKEKTLLQMPTKNESTYMKEEILIQLEEIVYKELIEKIEV